MANPLFNNKVREFQKKTRLQYVESVWGMKARRESFRKWNSASKL
jgi:hypothetical protein